MKTDKFSLRREPLAVSKHLAPKPLADYSLALLETKRVDRKKLGVASKPTSSLITAVRAQPDSRKSDSAMSGKAREAEWPRRCHICKQPEKTKPLLSRDAWESHMAFHDETRRSRIVSDTSVGTKKVQSSLSSRNQTASSLLKEEKKRGKNQRKSIYTVNAGLPGTSRRH